MFLLMLDTGLRRGELIGLKFERVQLDEGYLTVMGKGRKERVVPFGFTAERALRRYAVFFRPTPALPDIEEFFLSSDGYPLSINAVNMIFARARERTNIKTLHPHALRHTFGTRAIEQGMPTIVLQHYMGHSSPKVTERYTHAAQSQRLRQARGYSHVDQLRLRSPRKPK